MKYLMFLFFMSFSIVSFAEGLSLQDNSNWLKAEEIDDFTGKEKLYFILPESNAGDNVRRNPFLTIRCVENVTELFMHVGSSFFSFNQDFVKIGIKIDDEKPYFEKFSKSSDSHSVFLHNPITFIKNLKDKSKLILRYQAYGETEKNAIFKIKGINQVIDEMSETCKWPKK